MVKRMLLLLFYYGLHLPLFFLQSTEAVINNPNFRINSAGQIEVGRDTNQCISVKADFSNKFRLNDPHNQKNQPKPEVITETCALTSSQLFRQVFIDKNNQTEFILVDFYKNFM